MSGPPSVRRPDPDALLERAREEGATGRGLGRLKVFFGAAPGVGKTYTMLEAARAKRAEGVDVVVGYVETHGRTQTERLLEGLEVLPRQRVDYRERALPEFDLDAALARRPRLLLVDELAHTNAPGCRHAKRWQDVLELIDTGIDVYTTVNVQHLESLNDVVARVTGVVVRETLPDAVLERADEVELIDLPPDELLQRLREGNVYVPEQAERAAANFFKKGNLIALRELALRRTAERVDEQMLGYRRAHGIAETWPVAERVLVCVGPSPMSARLVRAARRMASSLRAPWYAVSVESSAKGKPTPEAAAQIEAHLRLAESLGAQTATLTGTNVATEAVAFARRHNVTKIVVGKPTHPRWRDLLYGSLVDEVIRLSGDVDVYVITGDADDERPRGAPSGPARAPADLPLAGYARAAVAVVVATLIGRAMFPGFERADIVMVYLLAVVLVSFRLSRGPSTFAALLSIAAFDFFFVPPYLTFAVGDLHHFITFATMLLVALVVSGLAHRVRGQAESARDREGRTASLYAASRDFAGTTGLGPIALAASRHAHDTFGGDALVVAPDATGKLAPLASHAPFWSDKERGVAQWAFEHRKPAGRGTDTLPSAEALYLPLIASRGPVGVLGLRPPESSPLGDPARRHQLEALASQAALALERAMLVEEAQGAQLAVERERLLNALLGSISHDLRTPLASITGATSTLLEAERPPSDEASRELLQTAHQEAARLNRLVSNLLDMTRVTAGAITVKKEWVPLEEVVGAALTRLENELRGRPVETRLPADLPLVPIDAVLVEQVFVNLLENALKYTPRGAPIAVGATAGETEVTAFVDDRGPGVPPENAARVFEMFFRGDRAKTNGTGLGLAICRGMIAAHGGRIWVEPVEGGGASFRFTLPLDGPPQPTPPPPEPAAP